MKPSELIADPASWCQGSLARDQDGNSLGSGDPDACQWCMIGAIEKSLFITSKAFSRLERVVKSKGFEIIADWNDAPGRTHAEVIAALKEAGL